MNVRKTPTFLVRLICSVQSVGRGKSKMATSVKRFGMLMYLYTPISSPHFPSGMDLFHLNEIGLHMVKPMMSPEKKYRARTTIKHHVATRALLSVKTLRYKARITIFGSMTAAKYIYSTDVCICKYFLILCGSVSSQYAIWRPWPPTIADTTQ